MKALVLGAGYAARLYPLTKDRPKSLLPIGGRPILEWIIEPLSQIPELDEIFVLSNHRFAEQFEKWAGTYRSARPIRILDDGTLSHEDRLGAVGDMQFAIERGRIRDDLLVIAGDNLIEYDPQDFAAFFRKHGATVALKDLGEREPVSQYSGVELDAHGRIVRFEEKPPTPETSLISTGLYLLPRKQLKLIAEYLERGQNRDAPGYYLEWLHRQVDLWGYLVRGSWFDISDIDSYNKACELHPAKRH
ncbi:MAG: nucleotidyltransferase family protein [Planctomycetes bacterium]|nr:nucleotidyltransferase family protein [Planctomycetota bacterium]